MASVADVLQVIGAGLPRTGTNSLKLALELLLGTPCYHMFELFQREEHVPLWHRALDGDVAAYAEIFADFGAAVDWPTSSSWRELIEVCPDAVVVLTRRQNAEQWWRSADVTVWAGMRLMEGDGAPDRLTERLVRRFHHDLDDAVGSMAAYDRHLGEVRSTVPPERLVEMDAGGGWRPLCDALGLPEPAEPYPHTNTTVQFRAERGLDG